MEYLERMADGQIQERLNAFGAVLIEGPKWCGKTTSAEHIAASVIKLQDTEMRAQYIATAATNPALLLRGATPRLIDEWQDIPALWDAVRSTVDSRGLEGQFILTGSNTVDKSQTLHSGNGRISQMEMLPMSLWES
ncbi:MAG: AAA family ATPase, partial [Bacteroidales bacterium]|nr:AAA family ATPase [Bacteroidales bacterium]